MPWIPLVTAAISGISALSAGAKRRKAERGLENMQTPTYAPNQSILDYYQKALQKYETNPTDSAEYKAQKQNILQGTQQGIAASQGRRMAGATIAPLIQGQNNALLKAAISGEQRKAQEFQQLGSATQMRAQEEGKAFNQNYIAPFEKNYNLLAMKAGNQAAVQNKSIENMYNNAMAYGFNEDGMSESNKMNRFSRQYGSQGNNAYNWARNNNMSFGQYKRKANKVGRKLDGFGY